MEIDQFCISFKGRVFRDFANMPNAVDVKSRVID